MSSTLPETTVQVGDSNSDLSVESISKAAKGLVIAAIVIVVLFIAAMAVTIVVRRNAVNKRKAEEEIIPFEPQEAAVDKNSSNMENTAEDNKEEK